VPAVVREIIADVERRGEAAVLDATAKFDKVTLAAGELRVPAEAIAAARATADDSFMALARRAIANIRAYQRSIMVKAPAPLRDGGRELSVRYTPMDRVGVYVPGGRAFYPSTVLMTVVPALVAGVRQVVICSPPASEAVGVAGADAPHATGETPVGLMGGTPMPRGTPMLRDVNPMVLALAAELGVDEVYRVGGAQAIAAMAVGAGSLAPVDKIVGPGNAFVAEAKRQLFGRVGIDSIAGPSEVLIIADQTARPDFVAADMLAQAEHDPGSAILVTTSSALAQKVSCEIEMQLAALSRMAAIRQAIQNNSAIIVVADMDGACAVANAFATEHLQIMVADERAVLAKIRNAGAIFLGPSTPVPLGDYYAGPSHVLPTGTTARFFSPLSCNDFLKSSSVIRYDAGALHRDARDVIDFARREGLTAHASAVEIRDRYNGVGEGPGGKVQ
jgi:histidinol dehydrogenase